MHEIAKGGDKPWEKKMYLHIFLFHKGTAWERILSGDRQSVCHRNENTKNNGIMEEIKMKTELKKMAAFVMAAVMVAGSITSQKADVIQNPKEEQEVDTVSAGNEGTEVSVASAQSNSEAIVVSIYPDGKKSRTVYPDTGVTLTGTALIKSALIKKKCEWSATLSGSMSDAYTTAYCSFGYGGKKDNYMAKSRFSLYKKSYDDSTKVDSNCGNAITGLFW